MQMWGRGGHSVCIGGGYCHYAEVGREGTVIMQR